MRILIDTNIFIQLEDSNKEIAQEFADFHKIAIKHCQLCIHPKTKEDIQQDTNTKRRNEMLSRIKKYDELESPPDPPQSFLIEINCNTNNRRDLVDSHILYSLKQNCISILISEDIDLHTKARRCSIENIYRISEGLALIRSLFEKIQIEVPHINGEKLHNLNKDDSIFDSLKADYPEIKGSSSFEKWFIDGQRKGRDSWVYYLDHKTNIGGICIYKDEDKACEFYAGKVLKVCTFKVAELAQGKKVGELLIKNLFMYCIENKYEKAYVTIFEKHSVLVDLFVEFGFQLDSRLTGRGEKIYSKDFTKPDAAKTEGLSKLDFHIQYSPYFYTKSQDKKFIIPIMPEWHTLLFPECQQPNQQLMLFAPESRAYGNSIKKAYLCNSRIKNLAVGDLIIFYRSKDLKAVTTLGIIENIKRSKDADEIGAFVGKRTVFPFESIKSMCKTDVLAILFRQIGHLDGGLTYKELRRQKIVNNHLESITAISHNSFELLTEKFKDECILAN